MRLICLHLTLGYGNELCFLFDTIGDSGTKGLFANLASSHPDKNYRIGKLQQLGATYKKNMYHKPLITISYFEDVFLLMQPESSIYFTSYKLTDVALFKY